MENKLILKDDTAILVKFWGKNLWFKILYQVKSSQQEDEAI